MIAHASETTVAAPPLHVAIIGQPNTGKTSLFNRLTGLRQRVGNYPGVTVERKEGRTAHEGRELICHDLPGTYSLNAVSPDEQIAVDALCGRTGTEPRPDVILCVAEASQLHRSLLPAIQASSLGIPIVIAANFIDEAHSKGLQLDFAKLEQRLGVPVIPTVGHKGRGIGEIKEALVRAAASRTLLRVPVWPDSIREALDFLTPHSPENTPGNPCAFTAQRALFDTSVRSLDRLAGAEESRKESLRRAHGRILSGGHHPATAEPVLISEHIRGLLDGCIVQRQAAAASWARHLDNALAHPFWGTLIFALVMLGVFQAVYSWSGPLMDAIETATSVAQQWAGSQLGGLPMLQSLVADGLIAGVGSVLVFLPQILILTLLIGLLEDTGYLARAAFLADRLFSGFGLSGKSFVPLMSSYACAIPGIMATRTIEDPRTRLTTIFIAPLMSCSARLPVYLVMIGAFVEPVYGPTVAALALFAMHLLGPVLALPLAWFLQKLVLKAPSPPFLLELPPYRLPSFRDVFWRVGQRGQRFLTDAGTVIFCITILIWAMLYFPRPEALKDQVRSAWLASASQTTGTSPAELASQLGDPESEASGQLDHAIASAYLEQSILGRAGKAIQPLFAPAGFDWKITVGVLASFPAREVIISTLGVIYNLGGEQDEESTDLRSKLQKEVWPSGPRAGQPVFTVATAVAVMVFFALCMQCGATVAIMKAEAGWPWAVSAFFLMTGMAWVGAVLSYQILSRWTPV
ncbi:MAG: ferrous iron transport protein B [Candidatus Methylacidiphilales bacterium]|nr:ferrous iron transport protein B [Candidatus Methylacidiphilales bacterium]